MYFADRRHIAIADGRTMEKSVSIRAIEKVTFSPLQLLSPPEAFSAAADRIAANRGKKPAMKGRMWLAA
jgi:hypothetical protein